MDERSTLAKSFTSERWAETHDGGPSESQLELTAGSMQINVGIMTGGQGGDGGTGTDSGIGGLGGQGRGPQIAENLKAQSIVINHNHTELERKLEKWFDTPDPIVNQTRSCNVQNRSPCSWLFEDTQFISWQNNSGKLLWIEGPSGTGKTIISSMIIEQLFNNRALRHDSTAIAYFYFDFTDLAKRSVDNALRRLVLQLSRQGSVPHETLKQQYDRCSGLTIPNYPDLLVILKKHLGMFDCTYLVLDALDEAEDHDHVSALVETICTWSNAQLHVLITSQTRPVFERRFTSLKNSYRFTIDKDTPSADIKLYISNELASRREFHGWKPQWAEITDLIVEKSAGMFRLAACLLQQVRKCARPGDLKKALAALPDNLHDIYAKSLRSVPEEYLEDIKRLLQWLAFSETPLTLAELEDTITFDFSNPDCYIFDPHTRHPIRGFFLEWLSVLVTVTGSWNKVVLDTDGSYLGGATVILAHSSVLDYLQKPHPRQCTSCPVQVIKEEAHQLMAQTCVCLMLYFGDHPLNSKTMSDYPLARYAGRNWTFHLMRCHDQATLSALTKRLLEPGSRQYAALNFLEWWDKASEEQRPMDPPLYLCTGCGYIEGVKFLLEMGDDPNAEGQLYSPSIGDGYPVFLTTTSALQVASARGHLKIVRLLLDNGANLNPEGEDGSALKLAVENGHLEVVEYLLDKGANPNARSVLQLASEYGHIGIVESLISSGTNINAKNTGHYPEKGTALEAASAAGHLGLVRLLLAKGAKVNAKGVAALHYAADHPEIFRLLLHEGASINAVNPVRSLGDSLLASVSASGHIELVRLLLERGAGVNTTHGGKSLMTALQAASSKGHFNIVHLLLENGANVNAHGVNGTALWIASSHGHVKVVRLLIDRGANVNGSHGFCPALQVALEHRHIDIVHLLLEKGAAATGAALHIASRDGHIEIVRLLLENGADIHCDKSQTALCAALKSNHIDIVHLLLENSANVNAMDEYHTPLIAALGWNRLDMVHLLLEKGADINLVSKEGESALQAALHNGHIDIARILLDKGANVNAKSLAIASENGLIEIVHLLLEKYGEVNQKNCGALQAAAAGGQEAIVRLLLEKGAEVNQEDGWFTALQAAANNGHEAIVQLLLDKGAHINADSKHGTALTLASEEGHTEIVKLLLEMGAEVDTKSRGDFTAFQVASRNGHLGIMELLLENGADVNAKYERPPPTSTFWWEKDTEEPTAGTALHLASHEGHTEVVKFLLEHGGDMNARSNRGTALELALAGNFFEIVDLLEHAQRNSAE